MKFPRTGQLFTLSLIGGCGHRKLNIVPELDYEWKTAAQPRVLYLTVGSPGSVTLVDSKGINRDYAIVGRAKSGEILAVSV